jgi:3D (Asp-Asp-Asp) domain-containing protein
MYYTNAANNHHLAITEVPISEMQDSAKLCSLSVHAVQYSAANPYMCTTVGTTATGTAVSSDSLHYFADRAGTRVQLEEFGSRDIAADNTALTQRQIAAFNALFEFDPKNSAVTSPD